MMLELGIQRYNEQPEGAEEFIVVSVGLRKI